MTPDARIDAVRARLGDVKRREVAAGFGAPSCKGCVFGPLNGSSEGPCDHIAHWERENDPVSGKWRGKPVVTLREARSADGLCGPEGLLFEPYSPGRKVARWLAQSEWTYLYGGMTLVFAVIFAVALIWRQFQ